MTQQTKKTLQYVFTSALFVLKRILVIGVLTYLGLGLVLFTFQSSFIYHPDSTDFQYCPSFQNAERISFASSRGYFTERSLDKVIVYYHGNAGRACDRAFMDTLFGNLNYSTYFVEYPGYGEGGQRPSMEDILISVKDTISFLETKNTKEVVVVGESLGVGPAAYHAAHAPVTHLILTTAYTNLAAVAFFHYPVYPMTFLLRHNFTPDTWLSTYQGRVSVILAQYDEVVPRKLGEALYEHIPSQLTDLYVIQNATHNGMYEADEFYALLKTILQ